MSSLTKSTVLCRLCGGKLDESLPAGSCPACLWGDLLTESPEADDLPSVEGYLIRREIGRGGMGVVYLASQENPAREVALKIVAPHSLRAASQRLRFMMEIEAMATVTHPALLPLYESGVDDAGRSWFTMRLASAGTLAERLPRYQGQWEAAARLMVRLGGAVQYSHERGILHRDLKPANVLFDDQDNSFVADFGLAKWAEEEDGMTKSSDMLGSPAYLAPEAVSGGTKATTTVSDVYGLGTIFYELLTGHRLYEGDTVVQVLSKVVSQPPVPPRQLVSQIPRDLEVITQKALARDPAKRYLSAAAFVEDINLWLEGKAILARPVGPAERCWIWARRNPALASLVVLFIGSLLAGGFLQWRANQRLKASLEDSDALVELLIRELSVSLAPLGRSDVLESIFSGVNQHYQRNTRMDAESLARQADFLTQWAQVSRPHGQNATAIQRLTQAMEKAMAATAGINPPLAAVRARVAAGWRLGEALNEGNQLDEAEMVLKQTAAYSAGHARDSLPLSILDAQLALQLSFVARTRGDLPLLEQRAKDALAKWLPLLPSLEQSPIPASYQLALVNVGQTHQLIAEAARKRKDEPTAKTHLLKTKTLLERWIAKEPGSVHFYPYLGVVLQAIAKEPGLTPEQVRTLLSTADAHATTSILRDKNNVESMLLAASVADDLAAHANKNQNVAEFHRWRSTMSERLGEVSQFKATDIRFLINQANLARNCARHHVGDDWPTARRHYLSQLDARKRVAELEGTKTDFAWESGEMAKLIEKHEGRAAADQWRAEFLKTLKPAL